MEGVGGRRDHGVGLGEVVFRDGKILRVRWVTDAEGRPFLSLWLWGRDREEPALLWPLPRSGLRLRPHEVEPLAMAIAKAVELARAHLVDAQAPGARQGGRPRCGR